MTWKEVIFPALIGAALAATCAALGYNAGRRGAKSGSGVTVVTDTLTVHDTVRVIEPKEIRKTLVKTIYVPAVDTLTLHDTLYVSLKREQRTYADSTYTAYVSGVRPRLDSIFVYPETRYINTTVETVKNPKAKRWGVGVTAGYGISTRGFVPYVGIGLSYNLITF